MKLVAAVLLVCASCSSAAPASDTGGAVRDEMREADPGVRGAGIVVGVIDGGDRELVVVGDVPRDAIFEIGSITKTFTATLLADMAVRGQVALDDPVAEFLPGRVKMPDGITLAHLATHASGLPRLPPDLRPADPENPYADYSVDDMYADLGRIELGREVGSGVEYSNLGFGLLGHALERAAGRPYADLVRERITGPLQMSATHVTLPPGLESRRARGHANGKPAEHWDIPGLAGAGALQSPVDDMLSYLEANVRPRVPLAEAITLAHEPREKAGGTEIALAWHRTTRGGVRVVWHGGGTGGFRSFLGFVPDRDVGVVALRNSTDGADLHEAAMALLLRLASR